MKNNDSQRAQTADRIKLDHSDVRVPDNIGACTYCTGATSKIQPLNVAFNAEFKKSVDRLTMEHLFANPELFMSGKVSPGDRRLLFTK